MENRKTQNDEVYLLTIGEVRQLLEWSKNALLWTTSGSRQAKIVWKTIQRVSKDLKCRITKFERKSINNKLND